MIDLNRTDTKVTLFVTTFASCTQVSARKFLLEYTSYTLLQHAQDTRKTTAIPVCAHNKLAKLNQDQKSMVLMYEDEVKGNQTTFLDFCLQHTRLKHILSIFTQACWSLEADSTRFARGIELVRVCSLQRGTATAV